jgi:hypothetical protein
MTTTPSRIGFISTRFSGTDGVSLETEKWATVFKQMGHECFYFSGESDRPEDSSIVVPEAHFKHPDIEAINRDLFDDISRSSKTSGLIPLPLEAAPLPVSENLRHRSSGY